MSAMCLLARRIFLWALGNFIALIRSARTGFCEPANVRAKYRFAPIPPSEMVAACSTKKSGPPRFRLEGFKTDIDTCRSCSQLAKAKGINEKLSGLTGPVQHILTVQPPARMRESISSHEP